MNTMRYLSFFPLLFFLLGCNNNSHSNQTLVQNYIDSICKVCAPKKMGVFEWVYLDSAYMNTIKYSQWIFADTINKYSSNQELHDLASDHKSPVIRYVAFSLLLKRAPHEAIQIAIDDIENNDTIVAVHLDEGLPESLSSIRVNLVQRNRAKYNVSIEDSIKIDKAVLSAKNRKAIWYYYVLTDPQMDI